MQQYISIYCIDKFPPLKNSDTSKISPSLALVLDQKRIKEGLLQDKNIFK